MKKEETHEQWLTRRGTQLKEAARNRCQGVNVRGHWKGVRCGAAAVVFNKSGQWCGNHTPEATAAREARIVAKKAKKAVAEYLPDPFWFQMQSLKEMQAIKSLEGRPFKFLEDGRVLLPSGERWTIHAAKVCKGEPCVFHNPSAHHMVKWPVVIRTSTLAERTCEHGVGHPDPDSLFFFKKIGVKHMGVHGCDGCCKGDKDGRERKRSRKTAPTGSRKGKVGRGRRGNPSS